MFTDLLLIMQNSRKIILFDIDYTLFDTERFKETNREIFSVYDDVHDTLTQLSFIADLGIFSEGDIAFQNKKLQKTNIEKYFLKEHTHIVAEKVVSIASLVKKYRAHNNIFLVDDRLQIFPLLKKEFPKLFTIWMRKKSENDSYQEPIEGFSPDAEVKTLKEIIPLIANY